MSEKMPKSIKSKDGDLLEWIGVEIPKGYRAAPAIGRSNGHEARWALRPTYLTRIRQAWQVFRSKETAFQIVARSDSGVSRRNQELLAEVSELRTKVLLQQKLIDICNAETPGGKGGAA